MNNFPVYHKDSPYKHIFIFLGEPRLGKTTLAYFASQHKLVQEIDTDKYSEDELFDQTETEVRSFLNNLSARALLVVVGKHRKENDKIIKLIQSNQSNSILISICRFTK